jgi:methyl-accepting chemotaxis protein
VTRAASGTSRNPDTAVAVREAVAAARARLVDAPLLGFLFASSKHPLGPAAALARECAGCEFLASSTAGEFTEAGAMRGGLVVLLISSETMLFSAISAAGVRTDPTQVAKKLAAGFGSLVAKAASRGLGLSTSIFLVDSLGGNGERVVKELLANTRLFQQIVGGAAGDDGQFREASVGTSLAAGPDMAAVVHLFDSKPWGIGVDHGLAPTTEPMTVTRARGSVLYEIDRKPAFEVYREYAASRGVELEPQTASSFLIGNELGVYFLDELHHARAPVGVGPAGELLLVANISEGSKVCILDGKPDEMVAAARRAAEQARAHLGTAQACGVLVFDCICRGMILGRDFQREIDAVKEVFPETPIAGFLTYGEIAKFRGKLDGWHNATAVVAAIPA